MKMKISRKIMSIFVAVILFIIIGVGILVSNTSKSNITAEKESQLHAAAYLFKTEYETVSEEELSKTMTDFYKETDIDVTIFKGKNVFSVPSMEL